ncbi:MAG: hypothetical protein JSS99_00855 [Actinobacteria bacterium]|nr:hypothetical protein [Actinomycetota bacterium]
MHESTHEGVSRRRALIGMTAAGLGVGLALPGVAEAATLAQYNVQSAPYEARGDGSTDDARAIQEAINAANGAGGGIVYFPAGTYVVGTTLTLYSRIYLVGAGVDATRLRLRARANTDLVKSSGYDEAVGTGLIERGIEFAGLIDLTLEGNSRENTSGTGLKHYGRCLVVRNATISYCAEKGISSERGIGGEQMEAQVSGLVVRDCGGDGIDWRGPHDSVFVNVHAIRCAGTGIRVRGGTGSVRGGYGGAGTMFLNTHVWGGGTKAWELEQGAFLTQCSGEGASESQLHIKTSDCVIFGGNYFANNSGSYAIRLGETTGALPRRTMLQTRCGQATRADFNVLHDGGQSMFHLIIEEGGVKPIEGEVHLEFTSDYTILIDNGREEFAAASPVGWSRTHEFGGVIAYEVRARTNEGAHVLRTREDNRIAFFNRTPIARQTVTGSRGGNAALASLLTVLAEYGLITNSSTA